ncbi:membrane protein of unknown function [Xenorhabdus poinarii G6]|uniref:Uncharacterized protein n=1 Tax=Xenorhabdus poinarii G6 TaxID=1354304 RepID=A0A068R2L3_9GAMM|nr:membrane protein of unknown function [Xenorhabdus poinarii G6]
MYLIIAGEFNLVEPVIKYIDYIMALLLLTAFISIIVKVVNLFYPVKEEYENNRDKYLIEKTGLSSKILALLILICCVIVISCVYIFITDTVTYHFSLTLFFAMFNSSIIYLMIIIIKKV